jgi:head-tail adaptor
MRAGPLDRRVIVQRVTRSLGDDGGPIETWAAVGPARWARRRPVSGEERFTTEQLAAKEQVEFQLRWSSDLAALQPLDQIIEPASDASFSPVPTRSIYDIVAVQEVGRREGLRVVTARRADVT